MTVNSSGEPVYQWQRNGAWCVGIMARDIDGLIIVRDIGDKSFVALMRSFDSLHWVKSDDLHNYPQNPIPQPEVRDAGA